MSVSSPLMALRARAEKALKERFADVTGVGIGLRQKDGAVTNFPALRVYVTKKRALDELRDDEVIPATFEDYPVDVVEHIKCIPAHCEDKKLYARMIGGISISNLKPEPGTAALGRGTLGFFATIQGEGPPDNVALVSNHHVLAAAGAVDGDAIYQVKSIDLPSPPAAELGQTAVELDQTGQPIKRKIGNINNIGQEAVHPFSYDASPPIDYFVDCATAKLDIRISSTCNKSTGINYKNEIRKLRIGASGSDEGNSRIVDIERVRPEDIAAGEADGSNVDPADDYVVYKVGRRTSRTVGKVIEAYLPTDPAAAVDITGAMMIMATEPDCDGFDRFGAQGDSGAAIINADNNLVGILFGVGNPPDGNIAYASHIHPVIDYLGIDPITDANPPLGPAGSTRNDQPGALMHIEANTVALRARIEAHPQMGPMYRRFMQHWDEIVMLVNERRRLLVAWHRAKGPTYVAHLSESARTPGHRIPFEIDGIKRDQLVERMADLLYAEGSESLRAYIAAQRDDALALINSFDDLHQFVAEVEAENAHA